jgi:hypothetical protein
LFLEKEVQKRDEITDFDLGIVRNTAESRRERRHYDFPNPKIVDLHRV